MHVFFENASCIMLNEAKPNSEMQVVGRRAMETPKATTPAKPQVPFSPSYGSQIFVANLVTLSTNGLQPSHLPLDQCDSLYAVSSV